MNRNIAIFDNPYDSGRLSQPRNELPLPSDPGEALAELGCWLKRNRHIGKKDEAKMWTPCGLDWDRLSREAEPRRQKRFAAHFSFLAMDYEHATGHKLSRKAWQQAIMASLQGYGGLLYRSHSHSAGLFRGKFAFRVIIPLAEPITASNFFLAKDRLLQLFPGVDPTTFDFRAFYVPSAPARPELGDDDDRFAWPIAMLPWGDEPFDFWEKCGRAVEEGREMAAAERKAAKLRSKLNLQSGPGFKRAVAQRTKARLAKVNLTARGTGTVHVAIVRAASNLRRNGFDEYEAADVLVPVAGENKKLEQEIRRACRLNPDDDFVR